MKILHSTFIFFGILLFSTSLMASPLVSVDWLNNKIKLSETAHPDVAVEFGQKGNIVLIDLRNRIDGGSYDTFLEGHIPTSIHSNYEEDGSRFDADDGTIGVIPSQSDFQTLVRSLGINSDSHVVLIPAGVSTSDLAASTRSYWTLKVYGHDNVSILDGGYAAWLTKYPDFVDVGLPDQRPEGNFVASFRPDLYTSTVDVASIVDNQDSVVLLDGRPASQFYAEAKHPRARVAGRLPGADLLFNADAYDSEENAFKTLDELKQVFAAYQNANVISYCNTGHWAANNWFVLSELLGNKNVTLYDGSMVEWTSDISLPVDSTGRSNMDKIKGIIG